MKNHFMRGKSVIGFPFFVLFWMIVATPGVAQKNEIGITIGVLNYTGDLSRFINFAESRPGIQIYHRYNLNNHLGFRSGTLLGSVGASDGNYDGLSSTRQQSFIAEIFEISGVFDYYFLDYKEDRGVVDFSPYLFTGMGISMISPRQSPTTDFSRVQPFFPLGFGIRYQLSWKVSVSMEASTRFLFFDYLDNIGRGDQRVKDFNFGNPADKDRYHFIGLSFCYTIFTTPCPYPSY
jgi:hypothetical protein